MTPIHENPPTWEPPVPAELRCPQCLAPLLRSGAKYTCANDHGPWSLRDLTDIWAQAQP